jgi:hypothetical protein
MKSASLILILLLVSLISCKEDKVNKNCNVDDPVNELRWLKAMTEELNSSTFSKYNYILQGDYNGGTVFIVTNCCPMCNSIPVVYDCDGDRLDDASTAEIKNTKRVWLSKDNECVFYD